MQILDRALLRYMQLPAGSQRWERRRISLGHCCPPMELPGKAASATNLEVWGGKLGHCYFPLCGRSCAKGTALPREPGTHQLLWDVGWALPGPTPAPPSARGSSCLHTGGQPGAWWPGHTARRRSPCPPGCDTRRSDSCVPHHRHLSTWRNRGYLVTAGRLRGHGLQCAGGLEPGA